MAKTFYITTPIYYPSGKPHIGTMYTTVCCDILARWHRLDGKSVFFTTGLDEHQQKVEELAKKAQITPKKYVDSMVPSFKDAFKRYNISYDKFVRTTDPKHIKYCKKIIQKIYNKGDIYKGKYEGWYCSGCETYYIERELTEGNCPLHKTKATWMEEEAYFFKMSKYQKRVAEYIAKQNYILPKSRQRYLLNRMKDGVKDLSISRSNTTWGIQLPFDKKFRSYVWTDAIWNYVSSTETEGRRQFWPADLHMTGHDIMWHHSVIWLSLLFAAGVKRPKKLFAHGFILGEGGIKMSKSIGNVIDPLALLEDYPTDSVRYFLTREIPFGADGAFSHKALQNRHNNELVNDLGNLQTRTLTMIEKYCKGKVPVAKTNQLPKRLQLKAIKLSMDSYELHLALGEIWKFVNECNKYINDSKPWELAKKNEKKLHVVLYNLAESLRYLSILLFPFMPSTAEKLRISLGLRKQELTKDLKFGLLGNNTIKKESYLFTKIETKEKQTMKEEAQLLEAPHYIQFKDWEKMHLHVGKIIKIQNHPKADKLYVMMVDMGEGENDRQIVSGLKEHYTMEELMGKAVVVFANLQPRVIRGIESEGMLLGAEFKGKYQLLTPDAKITAGARVC